MKLAERTSAKQSMTEWPTSLPKTTCQKCLACFTDILNAVTKVLVGKTKPRWKAKSRITHDVRTKIRTRNRHCCTINANHQKWIEACREAKEAIIDSKTDSWKGVLEDAMRNNNRKDMWKAIRGLKSTPEANSSNEAMTHNCRTIIDAKAKANIFVNH